MTIAATALSPIRVVPLGYDFTYYNVPEEFPLSPTYQSLLYWSNYAWAYGTQFVPATLPPAPQ